MLIRKGGGQERGGRGGTLVREADLQKVVAVVDKSGSSTSS